MGSSVSAQKSIELIIGLGVVLSLLTAGCQSAGVTDKTGSNVTVLRFATIDGALDTNGQTIAPRTFVDALGQVSGGRLTATVQTGYGSGAVNAETDIVKAIASGDLDGGWPATRAFSRAGIRGLEPIEAPLTLTSYAAQTALVTGSAGPALLETLENSGVVGLGLTVGALRRPWATAVPLVDVQQWRGVTFRSYNSPVQEDTIRALGAIPIPASFRFPELLQAGSLQAVETDVAQYAHNGYGTLLPQAVGNEVLWPRMTVLSMSQRRFDSLTAEQQEWVRQAALQAVQASVDFDYDETTPAATLCSQGVQFSEATPQQLADLKRAVQPVLDALARDPITGPSLEEVLNVATDFPTPDVVDVPASCRPS